MLPRRHILDVWELIKDKDELRSMATMTLAIDAMKYMHNKPKKDHLVEALELNEFICFMFPAQSARRTGLSSTISYRTCWVCSCTGSRAPENML